MWRRARIALLLGLMAWALASLMEGDPARTPVADAAASPDPDQPGASPRVDGRDEFRRQPATAPAVVHGGVAGVVVDRQGRGVPDALVRFQREAVHREATGDDGGRFVIAAPMEAGRWDVRVAAGRRGDHALTVEVSADRADVRLEIDVAQFEVRLRDPSGNAVAGEQVIVWWRGETGPSRRVTTVSDADGAAHGLLLGAADADLHVILGPRSALLVSPEVVFTVASGAVAVATVRPRPTAVIRVLGPDGSPHGGQLDIVARSIELGGSGPPGRYSVLYPRPVPGVVGVYTIPGVKESGNVVWVCPQDPRLAPSDRLAVAVDETVEVRLRPQEQRRLRLPEAVAREARDGTKLSLVRRRIPDAPARLASMRVHDFGREHLDRGSLADVAGEVVQEDVSVDADGRIVLHFEELRSYWLMGRSTQEGEWLRTVTPDAIGATIVERSGR